MELRRGRSGYDGGVVALPRAICLLLCLFYVCAVVAAYFGYAVDVRNAGAMTGRRRTPLVQGGGLVPVTAMGAARARTRRHLRGPGSYPPRCTSKCGKCTPCKPVHIPVPPGAPVTTEYYPETWRCKCGHRLYMP